MCWQERNGVHCGGCGVNDIHEGDNDREQLFMYMFMHVYDGVDWKDRRGGNWL